MELGPGGNAVDIFSLAIALFHTYPRKLARCSVVEAAMWSYFVVLLSPIRNLRAHVEEAPEPVGPQTSVEALRGIMPDRHAEDGGFHQHFTQHTFLGTTQVSVRQLDVITAWLDISS